MRSQQQGAYPNLLRELNAEDPEAFRQFHRLDKESFETILAMVAPLDYKTGHKHASMSPSRRETFNNFKISCHW